MAPNEPQVSVGGLLDLGEVRKNSVGILTKYEKSQVTERKKEEGVVIEEAAEERVD